MVLLEQDFLLFLQMILEKKINCSKSSYILGCSLNTDAFFNVCDVSVVFCFMCHLEASGGFSLYGNFVDNREAGLLRWHVVSNFCLGQNGRERG